jgi:N-acyl-D-amino-acid deacylase
MARTTAVLTSLIAVLLVSSGSGRADNKRTQGADARTEVRAAAERGLSRLEKGAASYVKNRNCFSCHHNAMAVFAMTAAKRRGLEVSPERLREQLDFTLASFRSRTESVRKGQGIGGANTTVAYALATLAAGEHAADETTAALVDFLLTRQREDGAWIGSADRPPSEGSPFTSTALALQGLRAYGTPAAALDAERGPRLEKAISGARTWLRAATPVTTEDRVFHLRGLQDADVDATIVEQAREALLRLQKESGAWPQLAEIPGDAYATGSALVALRRAGLPSDHLVYERGVRFLVETQQPDGAWVVQTRSKPVQLFFDNGDPGGKSQFISMSATGWATLALLESLPASK